MSAALCIVRTSISFACLLQLSIGRWVWGPEGGQRPEGGSAPISQAVGAVREPPLHIAKPCLIGMSFAGHPEGGQRPYFTLAKGSMGLGFAHL